MDVNGKGPIRKGLKWQTRKGPHVMTDHPLFGSASNPLDHEEHEIRTNLQRLMFRTKSTQIIRTVTALLDHFDGWEKWTELSDAPIRYLYSVLAPIERRRDITYDDVAAAIADMPALYYRCVTAMAPHHSWSPFAMPFAEFLRLYADETVPSGRFGMHTFIAPAPMCDGRDLIAHLLQQQKNSTCSA